jgi:predicted HTH domain antitoxin
MITVMDREIEVLLEKKIYSDKNELLREAYRSLLRSKPHLKIEAATELYSRGEISFSKAAEIAGMNFEEFKDELKERGIQIKVPAQPIEEIDRSVNYILKGKE